MYRIRTSNRRYRSVLVHLTMAVIRTPKRLLCIPLYRIRTQNRYRSVPPQLIITIAVKGTPSRPPRIPLCITTGTQNHVRSECPHTQTQRLRTYIHKTSLSRMPRLHIYIRNTNQRPRQSLQACTQHTN